MIQITFGNRTIQTGIDQKSNWEDLAGAHTNRFLIELLGAQSVEILSEMRAAIEKGDMNKIQDLNGYLKGLEDTAEFLSKLSEQLKDQAGS